MAEPHSTYWRHEVQNELNRKAEKHEVSTLALKVDGLERTVRTLRSEIDGLLRELQAIRTQ